VNISLVFITFVSVIMPKILVCAPTNKVKGYCQFRWIDQIKNLQYPNYQIFLSDNTKDDDFSMEIKSYDIEVGRVNPDRKSNPEYMAESHEQCRKKALEIGADYILHWEVDLFTDNKNIIQHLLKHNKPVVGGIYHIGQGRESYLCLIKKHHNHPKEPISTFPMKRGADLLVIDGGLVEVFSMGLGCTLIHKSVFSQIPFRHDIEQRFHPDSSFYEDLYFKGIKAYADTSLLLKHENSRWLMY